MHLQVKFKKNATKGKNYFHDLETIDEPAKGILCGKNCSSCRANTNVKSSVKCTQCQKQFHITCIARPISEDTATIIYENPSVWWVCMGCLNDQAKDTFVDTTTAQICDNQPSTDMNQELDKKNC